MPVRSPVRSPVSSPVRSPVTGLAFTLLVSAMMQTTLMPEKASGGVSIEYTNTTASWYSDHERSAIPILANQPAFSGSREVANKIDSSQDLANAAWVKGNAGAGATPSHVEGNTYRYTTGGTDIGDKSKMEQLYDNAEAENINVLRVLVSADAPTSLSMYLDTSESRQILPITTAPTTFTVTRPVTSTTPRLAFRLEGDQAGDVTRDITITEVQVQDVTGKSVQEPGEYVSTGVGTGSEELSNPTFTDNITGWAPTDAGAELSHIVATESLRINNGDGTAAGANSAFTAIKDKTYVIEVTGIDLTGSGHTTVEVGWASTPNSFSWGFETITVVGGRAVFVDTAAGDGTAYVMIKNVPPNVVDEYTDIGGVSIKIADHGANVDGVQYFKWENGNTVTDNVVTEARGTLFDATDLRNDADGPFGVLGLPQRQNVTPWSRDLTQWSQTGAAVSALDAVGIDSIANHATTLTDDDGAASEFVSLALAGTLSSNTNAHAFAFYVKEDADTSRFVGLTAGAIDGGDNQIVTLQLNTSTGALVEVSNVGAPTYTSASVLDGGFWKVSVALTSVAVNERIYHEVYPANGTVFGTASVAATGSCIAGHVEVNIDSTVTYEPTVTEGVAITVNGGALTLVADGNILDAQGTAFAQILSYWSSAPAGQVYALARGGSGRMLYRTSAVAPDQIQSFDGASASASLVRSSYQNAPQSAAATWGGSLTSYLDGDPGTPVAYDGTMGSGDIGILNNNAGANVFGGAMRFLQISSDEFNQAQVQRMPL